MLAGEHLSRPPEAGGHLVHYHEHVVAVAVLPDPAKVPVGGDDHSPRGLNAGLEDDGRYLCAVFLQNLPGLVRARGSAPRPGLSQRTPVAVVGRGPESFEKKRLEGLVENVDSPDGDRAQRVSVVAVVEAEKRLFLRAPLVRPVLKSHLEGSFHGACAVSRVKDLFQSRGTDVRDFLRKLRGRRVGHSQQGAVAHEVHLLFYGLVYFLHAVAVHVDPEGRDAVYVAVSFRVRQAAPLGALDDYRVPLLVLLHLGEGVPDEFPVVGPYAFRSFGHSALFLAVSRTRLGAKAYPPSPFAAHRRATGGTPEKTYTKHLLKKRRAVRILSL